MWIKFLQKFVKWIDPRLEKYREKKVKKPYAPKTLEEFIGVMQRTPRSILSAKDRERIAAVMSFDDRTVGDLMTLKDKIVFVKCNETLGPLTLDSLYKSGQTSFPVIDEKEKVIGILNTEALNALEVREAEKANKYMEPEVRYLKVTDSLRYAVEEMERTGGRYFLVKDKDGQVAGFFTTQILLSYLLG